MAGLLAAGANPNQTKTGATSLHPLAEEHGMDDSVSALCRHPAIDLNIQDNKNSTPLHIAITNGLGKNAMFWRWPEPIPRILDQKRVSAIETAMRVASKYGRDSRMAELGDLLLGLAERVDFRKTIQFHRKTLTAPVFKKMPTLACRLLAEFK